MIKSGDKVIRDAASVNSSKVHLGDTAPVFGPSKIHAGEKVTRDTTTANTSSVRLGDTAPVFGPSKIRAGEKVIRDARPRTLARSALAIRLPCSARGSNRSYA